MAYLAARDVRYPDAVGAFQQSRDNARKNALFEQAQNAAMEQQQFNQQNTLFQQQRQTASDEAAARETAQAGEQDERKQLFNYFNHLSRLKGNPQAFAATAQQMVQTPLFQKHQIAPEDLTPDQVDEVLPLFAAQAGQAPAARFEEVKGPRGSVMKRNADTGELVQVVGPDNTQPSAVSPAQRVRTLSPQETAAAGFPPGSVVQERPDGSLDVVNKREGLSAAEQKTVREAKMRMPRLNATLRRVDRLGEAVAALSKNKAFDGGPLDARILSMTKDGREVMAASAQVMPELQALTRVPGIGSQSDLEARLASLALPSLEMPPEVNARSQAELRAFVEDLKAAYESIVSGGSPEQEPAPAAGGWSVKRVQ
jgi:hypothetical protein